MAYDRVDDAEFARTWPIDPERWIPKAAEMAFKILFKRLGNHFKAEDAIGHALGKLGEVLGRPLQFTHFGQLVKWLVTTGKNHIFSEASERKRHRLSSLDDLLRILSASADDAETDCEEQFSAKERISGASSSPSEDEPEINTLLHTCLEDLKPEARWALRLNIDYELTDVEAGILIFAFGLDELVAALSEHNDKPVAVTSDVVSHEDATNLALPLQSVILDPIETLPPAETLPLAIHACQMTQRTPLVYVKSFRVEGRGAAQRAVYEVEIHDVAIDNRLFHLMPEFPTGRTRRARGLAVWRLRDEAEEFLRSCLQAAR